MFAKVSKVSIAKYLTAVVWQMLTGGDNNGKVHFPALPQLNAWDSADKAVGTEFEVYQYTFEWQYNLNYQRTKYVLSGPSGPPIMGDYADEALQWMKSQHLTATITEDILATAQNNDWFLVPSNPMLEDQVQKTIYQQIGYCSNKDLKHQKYAKLYGTKTGAIPKKNVTNYNDSGKKLARVIPGMLFKIPETSCPGDGKPMGCSFNPQASGITFEKLVIHLNDHHKWPRSANDKPPRNYPSWNMSVNIADWSEEYALLHDLDMTFRTAEEMEAIRKEKEEEVKAAYHVEDEFVPFEEEQLYKALKFYGLEGAANNILTPKDLKDHPLVQHIAEKEELKLINEISPSEEFLIKDSDSKSLKKLSQEWNKKYDYLFKGKWDDLLSSGDA